MTPTFAIYGANGHTGRLVATELRARGEAIVLAGRDAEALRATAHALGPEPPPVHVAAVDDPAALRALAERADVLVHCAGPFSGTGFPVAAAAVDGRCHYVDHALEQLHVKRLFDELQAPSRAAGVSLVPGVSFYGGLGDLLAAAVGAGLEDIDRITVGYAVSGWRMTTGALATANEVIPETTRLSYVDGRLVVGYVEPRNAVYPFPPPVGPRTMIAPVPYYEPFTIPRHTPARNVEAQLTADTFNDATFDGEHVDPGTRAATDFTVAVQVIAGAAGRTGRVAGRDLWRAAALASVAAAVRLADGEGPGPGGHSPAEAFEAAGFLRTLEKLGAFKVVL